MTSPGPGYNYVALRELRINNVIAFEPGQWVPDSTIATQGWVVNTDISAPGAVIPSPAPLTTTNYSTYLDGNYAQPVADLRVLAALDQVAVHDQIKAAAKARKDWEDTSVGWSEQWTAVTSWNQTNLQASGGLVLGASTSFSGKGWRPLTGINTDTFRVTTRLHVSSTTPGTNQQCLFGITAGVAADGSDVATNMFGVGIWTNSGNLVAYVNGTPFTPTIAKGVTNPLPAGDYYITLSLTTQEISFVVNDAAGSLYARHSMSRAAWGKTASGIAVLINDTRAATGNGFGPIVARSGRLTGNPRVTDESAAYRIGRYAPSPSYANEATISTPSVYDSRLPIPTIIYCHGSSQTEEDVVPGYWGSQGAVTKALLDAGFMVAASSFGAMTNWGNDNALAALTELYQHLRDRYPIGPIGFWGDSMGNQVALNALARRVIPAVTHYGTRPATNLRHAFDTGYTAPITAAFGIAGDGSDYATKTAGHDPMLRKGWEFRGVPMRFLASPSDTSIDKTLNADAFASLVGPYTTDVTILPTTGDHTDNSHFQPTDAVAFFKRTMLIAA
jgi:hypothetical protein